MLRALQTSYKKRLLMKCNSYSLQVPITQRFQTQIYQPTKHVYLIISKLSFYISNRITPMKTQQDVMVSAFIINPKREADRQTDTNTYTHTHTHIQTYTHTHKRTCTASVNTGVKVYTLSTVTSKSFDC